MQIKSRIIEDGKIDFQEKEMPFDKVLLNEKNKYIKKDVWIFVKNENGR